MIDEKAKLAGQVGQGPQWISVKDKLPTPYKRVLVCDVNHVVAEGTMDGSQMWEAMVWDFKIKHPSVTHWMPLPAPPEVPHE